MERRLHFFIRQRPGIHMGLYLPLVRLRDLVNLRALLYRYNTVMGAGRHLVRSFRSARSWSSELTTLF